jgi:hypothetical protein
MRMSTHLGFGSDDLALTNTLALGSHGQRLLEVLAEDNVLDEHALDLDSPPGGNVFDDLPNGLGNLLATLNDVLEDTGTDDVTESSLGTLHERLADVGYAEGSLVRGDDVVVDDRGEAQGDVVLGHTNLLGDLCGLNLDVDLDEALAEGVDLGEAGVDSLVEAAELGDETDVALLDVLVRVGTDDAAVDGTAATDAATKVVDWGRQPLVLRCASNWMRHLACIETYSWNRTSPGARRRLRRWWHSCAAGPPS